MSRKKFLNSIIDKCDNYPIIFTTGYTCREAYNIRDAANHFYMVGSMGMASSIGVGLALNINKPVIVVDGDGSLLMNPSNLFMAATLDTKNLIHIVLDNGSYDSTGGQPTIANDFNFEKIAKSIGYERAITVNKLNGFEAIIENELLDLNGPVLISVKISNEKTHPGERIELSPEQIYKRFNEFVVNM